MNNFLLFTSYDYYPDGGWHDYKDSFSTLEAALEAAKATSADRWHVVDLSILKIVEHGSNC